MYSEQAFEEYRTTLESLRLDLVISKICKISRKEANIMIEKDLIKINHVVITKSTVSMKENDILSIRKHKKVEINW